MKKNLLTALALVVLAATFAWAATINVNTFGTDPSYTETFALISNATDTTNSTVHKFNKPFKRVSCIMSNPSGSVPAGVAFALKGGLDETNLVTLMTISTSSWPAMITAETSSSPDITHVQGVISTWTTNTGTTSLRLRCVASH